MDYQPKIQGSFLNTEKKKKKQTKQPCSALFKLTTKVCGFGFLVYATEEKKKKGFKIEVPEYLLLNGPDSLRLCWREKKKKRNALPGLEKEGINRITQMLKR